MEWDDSKSRGGEVGVEKKLEDGWIEEPEASTGADGIVIALGGLAGAHGRLLNPAVSISPPTSISTRRSQTASLEIYDICLHQKQEVSK